MRSEGRKEIADLEPKGGLWAQRSRTEEDNLESDGERCCISVQGEGGKVTGVSGADGLIS